MSSANGKMALWWQLSQFLTLAALVIRVVFTFVLVGPTNAGNVTIEGPAPFITDGTRSLTLTCEAPDFYPSPLYSWGGICASNTANCTITPRLDQDGGDILCYAINPELNISEQAFYTLNLTYPPPEAPVISTDTNHPVLLPGDKVTCTVTGGKPLVKSVMFTCTNPFLADQDDVIGDTSVSSSFTVNTSTANEFPMHCICSATWDPEQGLYFDSNNRTFILDYPPPEDPVITTDTNTVLLPGDKVTCTVTGGKPLVTSVMFTCTNPFLADQDDVIGDTSVSSSVMVYTMVANEFPMHCNCSAVWGPKPEVYSDSSNRTFLLNPPLAEDINITLVAGCAAAGGVFIMFLVFIVCICRCRKGHHADKHSAETDERPDSYAESIMIRNSIYESASVLELSLGPFNATSHPDPPGHYATVGPPEANHKAPTTNGSSRTPDYEDAGYAVAGFGLGASSAEQPHIQPTTVPTVSPAPENHVYAVVNKHKKQ